MPSDESQERSMHPLLKCPDCYRIVVLKDRGSIVLCSCGAEMQFHHTTQEAPFGSERLGGITIHD